MNRLLSTNPSVAGLFVLMACVMLYPISAVWDPRLPDSDDAMFSVWRLAWVAHGLIAQPTHLFDANIFYPTRNTLAYSDAMILLGVASAPLQWIGVHPVLIHNLLVVLGFAFAAYGAFALCRYLTASTSAALIAGVIFAFAPYRIAHIGHLELLWTAFLPLATLLTLRVIDEPSIKNGTRLGLCVVCQGLVSIYYFVFLCLYLALLVALIGIVMRPRLTRGHLAAIGTAILIVAALIAPYGSAYAHVERDLWDRSSEEIRQFSAVARDYVRVASPNRLYGGEPRDAEDEHSLFPGVTATALAVLGLCRLRTSKTRRQVIVFSCLAFATFDLSLGLNGWLYPFLLDLVAPLHGLRAPARFAALFLLCLSVLSAYGLDGALSASRFRRTILLVVMGLCFIEYWSAPLPARRVPMGPLRVHQWLERQRPGPLLELPLPDPSRLWGSETTHQFMSIYHWWPLVNGYSGHAPAEYVRTLEALREFPHGQTELRLRELGVRYVLVHERLIGAHRFAEILTEATQVATFGPPLLVEDDKNRVAVFPVLP